LKNSQEIQFYHKAPKLTIETKVRKKIALIYFLIISFQN